MNFHFYGNVFWLLIIHNSTKSLFFEVDLFAIFAKVFDILFFDCESYSI